MISTFISYVVKLSVVNDEYIFEFLCVKKSHLSSSYTTVSKLTLCVLNYQTQAQSQEATSFKTNLNTHRPSGKSCRRSFYPPANQCFQSSTSDNINVPKLRYNSVPITVAEHSKKIRKSITKLGCTLHYL